MPLQTKKNDPAFDQTSLVYRFKKHVAQKKFLKGRGKILIACSGGPDSVALFHLTRLAFPEFAGRLVLAHFNHGLRAKTAKRDELFVKKLAHNFDVSFLAGRADKKKSQKNPLSIEERARAGRYSFLKQACRRVKAGIVLFAHHLDDQAETVLMRVCQGTGPRGLLAIRERMSFEGMPVARPLLPFSKKELVDFLKQNKLSFCHDETNQSTKFLRNRLRLEVLPFLERKVNPRILWALARISEISADEQDLFEKETTAAKKKCLVSCTPKKAVLRGEPFRALHTALQFRVLEAVLKQMSPSAGLLYEHWTAIKKIQQKTFRYSLARGFELSATPARWVISCAA